MPVPNRVFSQENARLAFTSHPEVAQELSQGLAGIMRTHAHIVSAPFPFAGIAHPYVHFVQDCIGRRVPLQKGSRQTARETGIYPERTLLDVQSEVDSGVWVISPNDLKLLSICSP